MVIEGITHITDLLQTFLYAEVPLSVQLQPPVVTVLDVAPYNAFSLICTLTVLANATCTKSFEWRKATADDEIALSANGDTINITNIDIDCATGTSVLVSSENIFETLVYSCLATVLDATESATSTVIVKGKCFLCIALHDKDLGSHKSP